MGYFQSRGLRGSALEEYINMTHTKYREHGLALVQKIPTPIKPVELDPAKGNIKKAYFEERSTVDYIGVIQGYSICFDAKECNLTRFPLKNIHHHQMDFMKDFKNQGGFPFYIIHMKQLDQIYLVPYEAIEEAFRIQEEGGPKSIPIANFEGYYKVYNKQGYLVHYLEALDAYIQERDAQASTR